ncbi:MAG: type II secretion system protein [Bacteroidota bacterium]
MKLTNCKKLKPGVTLIELTVVIVVILSLISVLFIGATAYRNGASRSACLIKQRAIHQAVLSHMNMNQGDFGLAVNNDNGLGATVEDQLVGTGLFFPTAPSCPRSSAAYVLTATAYPAVATSAVACPTYTTAANGNHIFTP